MGGMTRYVSPAVVAAAVVALLTIPARMASAPADAAWALKIDPLSSPAGDAASAPQLTATGERALVSWMERGVPRSLFKFAERTAAGWTPAKTVASGNDLVVNAADVPSVRALAD